MALFILGWRSDVRKFHSTLIVEVDKKGYEHSAENGCQDDEGRHRLFLFSKMGEGGCMSSFFLHGLGL